MLGEVWGRGGGGLWERGRFFASPALDPACTIWFCSLPRYKNSLLNYYSGCSKINEFCDFNSNIHKTEALGSVRVHFFKKIQDWILKSERIRKRILRFFTQQINPRSLGSWCIKGTEESTLGVDSSAPLRHCDPKDLGLIC